MLNLGGALVSWKNTAMKFDVNQIFSLSPCVQKNWGEISLPGVSYRMPVGHRPAGAVGAEDTGVRLRQVV